MVSPAVIMMIMMVHSLTAGGALVIHYRGHSCHTGPCPRCSTSFCYVCLLTTDEL